MDEFTNIKLRAAGMYGLLSEILGSGALRNHYGQDDDLSERIEMAVADHEASIEYFKALPAAQPVAWYCQHVMSESKGVVESWLTFNKDEEPELKTPPGASFVIRAPLFAVPMQGGAAAPWYKDVRNFDHGNEDGKRSTSAATASGHELPNDTAVAAPAAGASLSMANGGDARVASAGCPIGYRSRDGIACEADANAASLVQGTEATAGGGATPGVAPSAETVERDGCDPSLLGKKIGYYPDGKPFGYITEQERADALAAYGVKEGQSG
jgi:hypothetical protein